MVDYLNSDAYPSNIGGGGPLSGWYFVFPKGLLDLSQLQTPATSSTTLSACRFWTFWPALFCGYGKPGDGYEVITLYIIAWPTPLLLGGSSALLLRSGIRAGRRVRGRRCVACGYDLGGLKAGVACPECGKRAVGDAARTA
ncbi:hypothetical protein BH11PLA1_BH11PLA1_13010 [soil metagenome]